MLNRLGRFFDSFIWIFVVASCVLIIVIALLTDFEVFMRYGFNIGQSWVEESVGYLILYLTFFGVAWLQKEDGHVSIDIVYTRLGPRAKLINDLFIAVVGLITCLIMSWYSAQITAESIQSGIKGSFSVLGIPRGYILAVMPFGFITLTIEFVRRFYWCLKRLGIQAK